MPKARILRKSFLPISVCGLQRVSRFVPNSGVWSTAFRCGQTSWSMSSVRSVEEISARRIASCPSRMPLCWFVMQPSSIPVSFPRSRPRICRVSRAALRHLKTQSWLPLRDLHKPWMPFTSCVTQLAESRRNDWLSCRTNLRIACGFHWRPMPRLARRTIA